MPPIHSAILNVQKKMENGLGSLYIKKYVQSDRIRGMFPGAQNTNYNYKIKTKVTEFKSGEEPRDCDLTLFVVTFHHNIQIEVDIEEDVEDPKVSEVANITKAEKLANEF